jgi:hypothetical protein
MLEGYEMKADSPVTHEEIVAMLQDEQNKGIHSGFNACMHKETCCTKADLLAELYQVLGALDAPRNVLDQVLAAVQGEKLPLESLLPFTKDNDPDASRWISVSERLPGTFEKCDWLFPKTTNFKEEQWILCGEAIMTASVPGKASHWRPVQELPRS